MAIVNQTTSATAEGVAIALGTANSLVVATGVSVASGSTAITSTGSNQRVTVFGTVMGTGGGIILGDSGTVDAGNRVAIGASGQVFSYGVALTFESRNGRIDNAGLVFGEDYAIRLGAGITSGTTTIANGGTIRGNVAVLAEGASSVRVQNTGVIESTQLGGFGETALNLTAATTVSIGNHGLIRGDVFLGSSFGFVINHGEIRGGLSGGAERDNFTNHGRITGVIYLQDGSDLFTAGATASGTMRVQGGQGDDAFTIGGGRQFYDGEEGFDWVQTGIGSQGVIINLDNWRQGGAAANVWLSGIENVAASDQADQITGSADVNFLQGFGGRDRVAGGGGNDVIEGGDGVDTLTGGSGHDQIEGGAGVDILTGGGGDDAFLFASVAEFGDTITDFGNATGNNDWIWVSAALAPGLVVGTPTAQQFIARNDNKAQDANDRFIFRLTDKTLWFDSNGSAAGGSVMLADLQASATLTRNDIEII